MLRNIIFTSIALVSINLIQAQTINYQHIFNNWKEGTIDAHKNVVEGGERRGGWDYISLKKDSTAIYSGAFTCGFGSKSTGTWTLDKQNNILTFLFTKVKGYMYDSDRPASNHKETYHIKKLNESELILIDQNSYPKRQLAFYANQTPNQHTHNN